MKKHPISLYNPQSPIHIPQWAEEFLAWSDEDVRAEWVDGEIILLDGVTTMIVEDTELTEHAQVPKPKVTFEEYLASGDENIMTEWVDGDVIVMAPAAHKHQQIGSFLEKTLGLYVEMKGLGEVLRAPFAMRVTPESKRGREPDLLFVNRERSHLIEKTYLNGAADLAIEIISPDSIGRDRGEKFVEYEQAGIKEYWLIDPERESVEFYELGKDGRYRTAALDKDGVYHSKVVAGFWLRVGWLWQTPPPTLEALRELKLLP